MIPLVRGISASEHGLPGGTVTFLLTVIEESTTLRLLAEGRAGARLPATAPGPGRGIGADPRFQLYEASDLAAVDPEIPFDVGSRLETVATSTPAALPHWSDSPATSLHRPLAAAVHANSRIPLPNA